MKKLGRGNGRFSIWKVPNYLLEPRGSFLGESVESIDRLAKLRSVAGTVIVIGMGIYYAGLSHLTSVTTGKDGVNTVNLGGGSAGDWFVGIIVSVCAAMVSLPLISALLVLAAKPSARKATLLQFRFPFIAIAGFWGILAGSAPLIGLGAYATRSTQHMSTGIRAVAYVFCFFVGIVAIVWIVKAFYLAATGMFRAEDGHPLLPLIAAPLIALVAACMMEINGYKNPPGLIGAALTWGGTISIFFLSVASGWILRQRFNGEFPFRNGPLVRGTAPVSRPPAGRR